MSKEGGVVSEDEEQEVVGQEDIEVTEGAVEGGQGAAIEGVVEELMVATPGEVSREEVVLGEVTMGDGNPQE